MAHTPGPWTACHHGKCKCKLVSGEHHPIAQIISGEWGDDYPNIRLVPSQRHIGEVAEAYTDRIVYGEIDEEIAQANANLIASSPNLLAACKTGWHERGLDGPGLLRYVADWFDDCGVDHSCADALRNKADLEQEAIAKTEPEQGPDA